MKTIKSDFFIYGMVTALSAGGLALDLSWELGVSGGISYITLLIPGLLAHNRRAILIAAIAGSILTITGYYLSPSGGELWKIFLNRSLSIFAIWVTASLCLYHLHRENQLQRSNKLLDAISHAQSQFIQKTDSVFFFEELLEKTLSLTESEFGFIAELVNDSNGRPYLKSLATSNIRWKDQTNETYQKYLTTGLELYNFNSLYGEVISTEQHVISNQPSTDHRRGGLPHGHPPLHSFLGFPFIYDKKLFGMVCLANRPEGYDQNLVEYLQPFAETCGNLVRGRQNDIKRQRADKRLLETENRLYRVVQNAPIPLMIHSEDGQVHMVNKIWTELTGYSQSDIPTIQEWAQKAFKGKESQVLKEVQKLYDFDKNGIEGNFTVTTSTGEKQYWDFRTSPLGKLPNGMKFVISMAIDITSREAEKHKLEASLEQLRNLSNRLQSIREEERKTIASDVHDEIGQILTSLKYDLNWMQPRISESQVALKEKIASMEHLIDDLIETVQRIATNLYPMVLNDLGLCEAVAGQAKKFQDTTGIKCELNLESAPIDLDMEKSIMVFRIFQETLTNVARHANASQVNVNFHKSQEKFLMVITDNGKGISEAQAYNEDSMGILVMRERARLWDGEVLITGTPGKGTTVKLRMPLNN
jgi:PAS domain S-box-containing protein